MSGDCSSLSLKWITKRTHLQISHTHVVPVLFKSRAHVSFEYASSVPPAFPVTEVKLSDAMPLLKQWLLVHLDRLYRLTPANLRPGSLETPDLLRDGTRMFTVWLEPTAATYAVLKSRPSDSNSADSSSKKARRVKTTDSTESVLFNGFTPTPQTLHVTAELDE